MQTNNKQIFKIMEQTMITLSQKEQIICDAINDGGCATFANVLAVVEQKMLKTGNPLKNSAITKLTEYSVSLNNNYQNRVNNALVREGKEADFSSKENWHTPVYDSFNGSIVAKKSNMSDRYLKMIVNNSKTHKYFVDGVEATPEQLEIIKTYKQKSNKAVNQGLENDVICRTIKVSGIRQINVNKQQIMFESLID
jgi:hypothetical protein